MIAKDLPIYVDAWRLVKQIDYITSFVIPKNRRYDLGKELRLISYSILKYIRFANSCIHNPNARKIHIENILASTDFMQDLLRLCNENKFISESQTAAIFKNLSSVGKQATAWKNKT